jgi:hypothetical protein
MPQPSLLNRDFKAELEALPPDADAHKPIGRISESGEFLSGASNEEKADAKIAALRRLCVRLKNENASESHKEIHFIELEREFDSKVVRFKFYAEYSPYARPTPWWEGAKARGML